MKEYELVITYKCNWFCDYCAVDTHNQKEPNISNKIDLIEDGSNVTLSGGELGLLKEDKLLKIIKILLNKNCNLAINTNGLFIKVHPKLFKYFEYILYHCSENLNIIDIPIDLLPNEIKHKTDYLLVLTDNNIDNLDSFLKRYPYVFKMVPSTMPNGIKGTILSKYNYFKILKKYYKFMDNESRKDFMHGKKYDNIIYL